jgi:hypothetical protein
MAGKTKVITDFTQYGETEIGPTTATITDSLNTFAADFPDLPVPTATLISQNGAYTTILGKADYHGKSGDLSAARTTVNNSLRDNGNYINNDVAKGDLVLCQKSGYPLAKTPQPKGPFPKTNIRLTSTDNAGEFEFEITGVTNADGYILCLIVASGTETNPHKWQWHWSSKSKGIISGLLSSTRYRAVSVAVGSDPLLTFSDPVEKTTQ